MTLKPDDGWIRNGKRGRRRLVAILWHDAVTSVGVDIHAPDPVWSVGFVESAATKRRRHWKLSGDRSGATTNRRIVIPAGWVEQVIDLGYWDRDELNA